MTKGNPSHRFTDQVVIVTGAGGGIGSAISERFASEGAKVVVTDVNQELIDATVELVKSQGGDVIGINADISDEEAAHGLIDQVIAKYGRVDVLCNNAGINIRGPLMAISAADFKKTMDVNLFAMVYLCQAVIPYMQKQGGGSIVNTASQWGLFPAPNHIAYNVSKAAVVAFTKNLARDYAPDKIRVNGVCPGEIGTPMLQKAAEFKGLTFADFDKLVPFGRIGKPAEVAALYAFLASEESAFMCGSLVEITGAQPVA